MRPLLSLLAVLVCFSGFVVSASAQRESTLVKGPQNITLGESSNTVLNLPKGAVFVGPEDARKLMEANGNSRGRGILGLVSDEDKSLEWFGILRYIDCGYIRDDEGERLNADNLLNSIRTGTEKSNAKRREEGIPEMEVVGWFQPPTYNRETHTLAWSIIGREKNTSDEVINYTTILLGRRGFLSCTTVGDRKDGETLQVKQAAVNKCIVFSPDSDYTAFRSGDKIAEVTMTGLVTGGAAALAYGAAKTGLLAKFLAILFALKKGIVVVVMGIVGAIKMFFNKISRRDKPDATETA
jgi:uncharacterized membrane-anchored protein